MICRCWLEFDGRRARMPVTSTQILLRRNAPKSAPAKMWAIAAGDEMASETARVMAVRMTYPLAEAADIDRGILRASGFASRL